MQRRSVACRKQWQSIVESQGLTFHSDPDLYWNESLCYEFSPSEIDKLENVGNEVHRLCLSAVQHVIDQNLFAKFAIAEAHREFIIESWQKDQPHLYGRFDFAYDGADEPKLLEYNADTPTTLLESSVIQWFWLQDQFPKQDQFNSIHEKLIARWRSLDISNCHFSSLNGNEEDWITTEYLRDTAIQAGVKTEYLFLENIGYCATSHTFHDDNNKEISHLFKLYPWEWMIYDEFGQHLKVSSMVVCEPAWKMLLSNKALLPLLWELYPGHPNLLPAYFNLDERLGPSWVKKPIYSREGSNILINHKGALTQTHGEYGEEGFIFQQYSQLPNFDGNYPVIGLWMVGDDCCGLGIREDHKLITSNTSQFIPHYIKITN